MSRLKTCNIRFPVVTNSLEMSAMNRETDEATVMRILKKVDPSLEHDCVGNLSEVDLAVVLDVLDDAQLRRLLPLLLGRDMFPSGPAPTTRKETFRDIVAWKNNNPKVTAFTLGLAVWRVLRSS